jgi:flagellar FliL protein
MRKRFSTKITTEGIMADISTDIAAPKKRSKMPMLLGLLAAIAFGGGGFYVMYFEVLGTSHTEAPHAMVPIESDLAYVQIEPVVISLGPQSRAQHLRFAAQLEVVSAQHETVTSLLPRIVDVLNTYLRAVDSHELEEPSSLTRLRGQLLRRIKIVTGNDLVRDLLITEFVLN